jgi:hypothetical protein
MTRDETRLAVRAAINKGARTNAAIVEAVCGGIRRAGYVPEIDRAIQALRKAGEITYVGGKWHLAAKRPCSRCGGTGKEPRHG